MRSIEEIRDTGSAWVTEAELAMLCAFAKRAEAAEAGMGHALPDQQCSAIEHKALRAEVERLRAALMGMPCMQYEGAEFWCKKDGSAHSVYCPVSIARAALAPEVK